MYRTHLRFLRFSAIGGLGLTLLLAGCAGQTRESGKLSEPSARAKVPASTASASPAVLGPGMPAPPASEEKSLADSESLAPSPQDKMKDRAPSAPALRARGASLAASPSKREAPKTSPSSAKKAGAAESGAGYAEPGAAVDDPTGDARPAYAEPPELLRAIADFDSQWETFSTTRACDDACRAWQSMKRSAERICALVLDGDPRERCPTARARLDQASRELTNRCSSCK